MEETVEVYISLHRNEGEDVILAGIYGEHLDDLQHFNRGEEPEWLTALIGLAGIDGFTEMGEWKTKVFNVPKALWNPDGRNR